MHRSRPVAVVEATTTFDPESKLVSLDDKRCALRDGKKDLATAIQHVVPKRRLQKTPSLKKHPSEHSDF